MRYAIIVPFNYKKVDFDTIKSATENTKPFLYFQLDLLINKLGFDKVFIIHKHENVSNTISSVFKKKYEFVHPLDMEYSDENEELYYLKSFAIAISRIPDSANELCIIGDNILIDPIINYELMTYTGNRYTSYVHICDYDFPVQKLYNTEFRSSGIDNIDLMSLDNRFLGKGNLLPVFNLRGSALEFLRLKFTDNCGLGLLDNLSVLSKSQDFKVYSIELDDFREFYTFENFIKFRSEIEESVNNE